MRGRARGAHPANSGCGDKVKCGKRHVKESRWRVLQRAKGRLRDWGRCSRSIRGPRSLPRDDLFRDGLFISVPVVVVII